MTRQSSPLVAAKAGTQVQPLDRRCVRGAIFAGAAAVIWLPAFAGTSGAGRA